MKILAIMPISIGGRLTTSSLIDGCVQNNHNVFVLDELKNTIENFDFLQNFDLIIGYDFSPIKIKIDLNLDISVVAYFSDDIEKPTSGIGYKEYKKYLLNDDIYVFYWDRELFEKEKSKNSVKNLFYQPHFVNCEIYKDFSIPQNDILFMGRFDTDLRLNTYLKLNEKLDYSFSWYAIEKHYNDALSRCETKKEKEIIKNTYKGFIDNEKDMASIINNSKIVYNINAQGLSSLNYRTIQVLACRRLIISDKRDELGLFNNLVPTYNSIDELIEKIDYYLKNTKEYSKIVEKTYEIAQTNHNSNICVKNMLNLIKLF